MKKIIRINNCYDCPFCYHDEKRCLHPTIDHRAGTYPPINNRYDLPDYCPLEEAA
jgi:hypothetical protein